MKPLTQASSIFPGNKTPDELAEMTPHKRHQHMLAMHKWQVAHRREQHRMRHYKRSVTGQTLA